MRRRRIRPTRPPSTSTPSPPSAMASEEPMPPVEDASWAATVALACSEVGDGVDAAATAPCSSSLDEESISFFFELDDFLFFLSDGVEVAVGVAVEVAVDSTPAPNSGESPSDDCVSFFSFFFLPSESLRALSTGSAYSLPEGESGSTVTPGSGPLWASAEGLISPTAMTAVDSSLKERRMPPRVNTVTDSKRYGGRRRAP